MRVILLASGSASHLRPLHDDKPNCLLEVGGRTILSRAIGALSAHGLRRFTIVDGFMGDHVRADVLGEFPAEWFEFVRDGHHRALGSARALLLARPDVAEPVFVLDSDLAFDRRVVGRMLAKAPPDRVAMRSAQPLGLAVLSAETSTELFAVLERRVRQEKRWGERYDASLAELRVRGLALHAIDLAGLSCIEVAARDDLEGARRLFADASSPAMRSSA
jgi:choline kinase